jgi:hypothetical protein
MGGNGNKAHACVDAVAPSRFIAVHFPRWPLDATRFALWRAILRLRRTYAGDPPIESAGALATPGDPRHAHEQGRGILDELAALPTVVVEGGQAMRSGQMVRIIECCPNAAGLGLSVGMTVAQAESVCSRGCAAADGSMSRLAQWVGSGCARQAYGALQRFIVESTCAVLVLRADERAWGSMMRRLAACLERWVPRIAVDGLPSCIPHVSGADSASGHRCSLLGDLAGCAALFRVAHGTEQVLMRRIADSFANRGFETQLATASTIGAAVALARHGRRMHAGGEARFRAVPSGREAEALDPLPVEALRIAPAAVQALHAVEVRSIGQLARLGRGGVAARLSGHADGGLGGVGDGVGDGVCDGVGGGVSGVLRRRGAVPGRKRGRKAERTPAVSLFDQPSECDGQYEPRDSVRERAVSTGSAPGFPIRPSIDSPMGALIGGRDTGDPLLRLDQALGRAPESLIPIRVQEPVRFAKAFEGPTSRLDAIFVACGELIDQLATALESRREGMRGARWVFRHAQLPSDLSTDATSLRAGVPGAHPSSCGGMATRQMVSELELRLSAPTASRTHLWSMLRPKLEHLPLDHGVEEITVHLDDAARLRSIQRRLAWRPVPDRPHVPQSRLNGVQPQARQTDRKECRPAMVWSGLDEACAGWIPVGYASLRAGGDDARPEDFERLQEWIDLIAARMGRDCVCRVSGIAAGRGRAGVLELDRDPMDAIDDACGVAMHLGQRPSQRFAAAESAVIVGDASSAALAASIAERSAWCFEPAHGRWPVAAMQPSLHWRGRIWPLFAIDGWERAATPWWDAAWEQDVPDPRGCAQGVHAEVSTHGGDRAAAIARLSGRLHARLQIGSGLWLLARFPDRIAPSGVEGHLVHAAGVEPASRMQHVDQWRDRCGQAFRAGLAISVLGAWG